MKIRFFQISDVIARPEMVLQYLVKPTTQDLFEKPLVNLLNTLRKDLIVVMESDYVDYTYRNAFYNYYSTKFHNYSPYCLKLSLFSDGIFSEGIIDQDTKKIDFKKADLLKEKFLGFIVLRPLNAVLGRNVISVDAKKDSLKDIEICKSIFQTSALGLKMEVAGYPHASQDGEVMTCAETTVWNIVEYFSNKYPIYRRILPSDIRDVLKTSTYERQWPSQGLTFQMITRGLKVMGFNPLLYELQGIDKDKNPTGNIKDIIRETMVTCIESSLPLAICIRNNKKIHAVSGIGIVPYRSKPHVSWVFNLPDGSKKNLLSYNLSVKEIVVNDDNVPCYQKVSINKPDQYYLDPPIDNPAWAGVGITVFTVPLPDRVHLFPDKAVMFSRNYLKKSVPDGFIYRTFLSSSRDFRDMLMTSDLLSDANKNELLLLDLPRFIWVTVFGSEKNYNAGTASGILLVDATEFNIIESSVVVYIDNLSNFAYFKDKNDIDDLNLPDPFQIEFFNKNNN